MIASGIDNSQLSRATVGFQKAIGIGSTNSTTGVVDWSMPTPVFLRIELLPEQVMVVSDPDQDRFHAADRREACREHHHADRVRSYLPTSSVGNGRKATNARYTRLAAISDRSTRSNDEKNS